MALTLSTEARNAACNGTVDLCDQGAGAGKLKIKEGATVLCTITLGDPAFGNAATGVATAAGLPLSGTGAVAGNANAFDVTDSADNVLWSGTVTATGGGGDLTLDNVSIAVSQAVNVSSWTHTQPT
jgi:hypothetical protein